MVKKVSTPRVAKHRKETGRRTAGCSRLDLDISTVAKETLKTLASSHGETQRAILERLLDQELLAVETLPRGNTSSQTTGETLPRGNTSSQTTEEPTVQEVQVLQALAKYGRNAPTFVAQELFGDNRKAARDKIKEFKGFKDTQSNDYSSLFRLYKSLYKKPRIK